MPRWLKKLVVRLRHGRWADRVAAAREGRPRIVRLVGRVQSRMQQYALQWSEWVEAFTGIVPETLPVVDPELRSYARFFRVSAVSLLLAEVALAVWFAPMWSALTAPWAQVFAVTLAVLLALGCDLVARLAYRRRISGYSYRRIRAWAVVVAGVFAVCLTGFFLTRFFAVGVWTFNFWVAGLSISMPVLSGLLLAVAWSATGGNRYARRHEKAAERYREARQILDEVEELLVTDEAMRSKREHEPPPEAELVAAAPEGEEDRSE